VLLTVSGTMPVDRHETAARGLRPRRDYDVMAAEMDADLLDVVAARRVLGRLAAPLERVGGPALLLAVAACRLRRRYRVVFTDGEQVGLPFAALCRVLGRRGSKHVMIVHVLSVPKKRLLLRWLRLVPLIDRFVVYCTAQASDVRRLGARDEQVVLTPFMVDTKFFDASNVDAGRRRMICAVGLERRDYPTLIDAVRGLDAEVVIAAASPWSKQSDSSAGHALPANVRVQRYDQHELRTLYAQSAFTVMPLVEIDFQAGITAILESMAMSRAVVCTRTTGQTDTVIDGENGRYVPPADPTALRAAIDELLDDPALADELGAGGRRWVIANAGIERYARRLAGVVASLR
jgi:glycosyltransferase involved in cell wall biosynthesis